MKKEPAKKLLFASDSFKRSLTSEQTSELLGRAAREVFGRGAMDITNCGVSSLMTTVNGPMPLAEALERAEELYYEAAVRMFRFVKVGMDLKK